MAWIIPVLFIANRQRSPTYELWLSSTRASPHWYQLKLIDPFELDWSCLILRCWVLRWASTTVAILLCCSFCLPPRPSYLLGLLAMIKCSICSYQCDNWYSSNRKIACHANFSVGRLFLELARGHLASRLGIAPRWVWLTLMGNSLHFPFNSLSFSFIFLSFPCALKVT